MEPKYYTPIIIKNGRITLLTLEDFNAAVEADKSILLICNGSALIIGADKISENNYSAYTASISEETFSITDLSRFYKIIITGGIKVYMKSGGPAKTISREQFLSDTISKELEKKLDSSVATNIVQNYCRSTITSAIDKLKSDVNSKIKSTFDEETRKALSDNIIQVLMAGDTFQRLSGSMGRLIK